MKLLIVGDVVGKSGRQVLKKSIVKLSEQNKYDFIIVNGENSASGFGITDKVYRELISMGANAITGGNHTWDRPETELSIQYWDKFVRPLNGTGNPPGVGYREFIVADKKVTVVNLLGRVFMNLADDPFKAFDTIYESISDSVIIIDFHAEATSEKIAFANYVDSRATVVYGTHTHVQTNDLHLLQKGTLYITDVGMSGSLDSCIGMELECSINRYTSYNAKKMKVELGGRMVFSAIELEIDNGNNIVYYNTINIVD